MNKDFLFYQNKKIHYSIEGQGDTIVLLHGFMESLQIWKYFSNELHKNYQIVCIDMPGHGKSECIQEIHSMELMADIVKKVLDELNIRTFLLIGHSMGGYVSLQFAKNYPEMLKGLGLFHSQALADTDEAKLNRDRCCEIVKKNRKNFITDFIPDLFAPENVEKFATEIHSLQSMVIDMTEEAIIASLQGMKIRKARLDVLSESSVPVLFIFGKKDKKMNLPQALEQITLPENAEVLLLNIGHMGYIEAQNETLYTIKSFAARCFNIRNKYDKI
jgi:pimeloyl-ACP methyl ester carboxylesterase